ncbi:MAG: multiprotein-bridging factor 1 family protein [Catenulispora sp.]
MQREEDPNASADQRTPSADFGVRLRELRLGKGWRIRELATLTAISAGQIGNLEHGRRTPKGDTAEILDAALDAGGELIALAAGRAAAGAEARARSRLAISQTSHTGSAQDAESLLHTYGDVLDSLRGLGRTAGPRPVLGTLRASARTLSDTARELRGPDADAVWALAARYAEYTGWMLEEAGDHTGALRWTHQAVTWGARGGDETVAAYALVRRALIAQHRGDPRATVDYARRAAAHPAATTRIRAHAARREAQGHALLGDHEACHRALERSARLMDARSEPPAPDWGPRADRETSRLIEASCLLALRHFESAADLFHADLDTPRATTPATAENAITRFRIRQATAHAGIGLPDTGCDLLDPLLPTIRRLDSATIRAELAAFVTEARRHRLGRGEDDFLTDLAAVIRPSD